MGSALFKVDMWEEILLSETQHLKVGKGHLCFRQKLMPSVSVIQLCYYAWPFTYAIKDSAAVPAGDMHSLVDHASASPSSSSPSSPSETSSPSIRRCFCRY